MKVMIYENSYGFTSYSYKLCNALCLYKDVEVSYVTSKENQQIEHLENSVTLLKVLDNFNDKKKKNSISWLFNRIIISYRNIKIRNRIIKENRYDIVNIQETIPIVDQFYLKKIKKYSKIVLTVHDVIPPIKTKNYSHSSMKKVCDIADILVVHTEGNKKQLIDIFHIDESKIKVIPHGIDKKYNFIDKQVCLDRFKLPSDKKIILFYGLIREQKGLNVLLNALKDKDNYKLLIAGAMPNGESFDKYQKVINENNLNVDTYIQFIPNEWTDYLFQAADFIVAPYVYFYSQSGVFMQSIQYKKPVILSDVSSFREFLDKYNIGYIVKPNDVNDLSAKIDIMIEQLTKDPHYFDGELEKAKNDNSWDVSSKMYLNVFKEA